MMFKVRQQNMRVMAFPGNVEPFKALNKI